MTYPASSYPPEHPTVTELRRALARYDDWPPSGPHADRAESVLLADAARRLLDVVDTEKLVYQRAIQAAQLRQFEELMARPTPTVADECATCGPTVACCPEHKGGPRQ
jgi:hypothetical protein